MLKPVLEIFVLWHPSDAQGEALAAELAAHFHGGLYNSLLAGSIEVYMRSAGWASQADAPRPIPLPGGAADAGLPRPADFVAIVPLLSTGMLRAVDRAGDPWRACLEGLCKAQGHDPAHVTLLPIRQGVSPAGRLAELIANTQYIGEPDPHTELPEPTHELRCRDLVQALAQWISPVAGEQLRVFISHTKRQGTPEEPVAALVAAVRSVFGAGRIANFYDAHELQPGEDWNRALRGGAATSALLALRTDLYATREWCQREMLTAKVHGMPVVVLDALSLGEARGSFLMDHTPRIPVRCGKPGEWGTAAVRRAINLLADAWLHRVIWLRLAAQAEGHTGLGRYWWAPQAPEPSTLARWLTAPLPPASMAPAKAVLTVPGASPRMPAQAAGSSVRILHPDPPLAEDEREVLQTLVSLAGYGALDLATPHTLAARGA